MLARITALVSLLVLGACGGASDDPGLSALLRVQGAQFVPGPMPSPDRGPKVRSARVSHNVLVVGTERETLSGTLDPAAGAVAIGRQHDAGFWIVTVGVPRVEEPGLPSFQALLGLARDFPSGRFTLLLSATDQAGRYGPRTSLALSAASPSADAELVVALRWDDDADLDLHVIDPSGTEIWSRNINSWQPPAPGAAADAGDWQAGGLLDFDSNAQCVIDGRDEEHVSWQQAPPHGEYQVRVATASLCGQTSAHWSVDVSLRGRSIAGARGISLDTDTQFGAGAGAGARALSFAVP
ncbi:MAG: hypothetical protein ACHQ53_14575 [Polyangiales bacterium]